MISTTKALAYIWHTVSVYQTYIPDPSKANPRHAHRSQLQFTTFCDKHIKDKRLFSCNTCNNMEHKGSVTSDFKHRPCLAERS